jgi:RNA polymerase sigma factor (sigma-70 family)
VDEEALVREHLDNVLRFTHSIAHRFPWCELEDLEQVALEALVLSSRRYDPARGVPFRGFAHFRIFGAIVDHARQSSMVSRNEAKQGVRRYAVSLDAIPSWREPAEADPGYKQIELADYLNEAIAELPERDRMVVLLCEVEGLTQEKVGEFLGVSKSRVSQIRTKALRRMCARLQVAA